MSIKVKCPNSHTLKVPEKFANKKVKCPKCQTIVVVPNPVSTTDNTGSDTPPKPQKKSRRSRQTPPPSALRRHPTDDVDYDSATNTSDDFPDYSDADPGDYDAGVSSLPPRRRRRTKKNTLKPTPQKTAEAPAINRQQVIAMGIGLGAGAAVVFLLLIRALLPEAAASTDPVGTAASAVFFFLR